MLSHVGERKEKKEKKQCGNSRNEKNIDHLFFDYF